MPYFVEEPNAVKELRKKWSYDVYNENAEKGVLVGTGAECIVSVVDGIPDVVAAFKYDDDVSIEKANQLFYLHRIFSVLFPHNFPRFRTSVASLSHKNGQLVYKSDGEGGKPAHTVRDRKIWGDKEVAKYPFSEVIKASKDWGLGLGIDRAACNFKVAAKDGGEYYVDTIICACPDEAPYVEYMKSKNYSADDIETVIRSVARYKHYRQVEKEKN